MQEHNQYQDWALLALRVVVAIIFLYHGYVKWPITPGSSPIMMVLAVVEPILALAILFGVFTRYAALILVVDMLGAIYMKITAWHMPFMAPQGTGWEFDLMILAGLLILAAFEAGCFSMNGMMKNSR